MRKLHVVPVGRGETNIGKYAVVFLLKTMRKITENLDVTPSWKFSKTISSSGHSSFIASENLFK